MSTTTITSLAAVTAQNLTDAAVVAVDDASPNTRKATLAQLRTQLSSGAQTVTGTMTATAFKVGANQVVGARVTGWGTPTGTLARTTFDQSTVTLAELAKRVAALVTDLLAHGAIGP